VLIFPAKPSALVTVIVDHFAREKQMTGISEDDIRMRAYALWEADGHPDGSHDTHWLQALRELTEEAGPVDGSIPLTPAKASKLSVVKNEAAIEPATRKRSRTA
jgi:hypothetical protein